jgi:cyclopropane-fatty-acyl-phospholipid synthase
MIDRLSKSLFVRGLDTLKGGTFQLTAEQTQRFGDPAGDLRAVMHVADDRFFTRALAQGDIGIGESYMDGDWSSPDLVTLIRLMLRNMSHVESRGGPVRLVNRLAALVARRLRNNTVSGSRQHIHRHYDLGNEFFRLFLDRRHLMYSCGFYERAHDSLETAQEQKIDRICRKLDLGPDDHVLEIGTGWGGFAVWAATRYGCRVTTTTISDEQYRHAWEWVTQLGEAGSQITVLREDYRTLGGRFDKIVSIEMFEAVGLNHYDDYFGAVDRLLAPDGVMLLQTITMDEQWFPVYRKSPDWIEKYIFPGGELASVGEIMKSLARTTDLSMYHAENIGTHYARTLHAWRERFHAKLDQVRALGFDDRFIRMWDLYLASSEANFLERHAGTFQLLLSKNGNTRTLFNEPRAQADEESAVA